MRNISYYSIDVIDILLNINKQEWRIIYRTVKKGTTKMNTSKVKGIFIRQIVNRWKKRSRVGDF